jgi:hypothetical protein
MQDVWSVRRIITFGLGVAQKVPVLSKCTASPLDKIQLFFFPWGASKKDENYSKLTPLLVACVFLISANSTASYRHIISAC